MNAEEQRVWSAGGGLAAMALGMALIPLRECDQDERRALAVAAWLLAHRPGRASVSA